MEQQPTVKDKDLDAACSHASFSLGTFYKSFSPRSNLMQSRFSMQLSTTRSGFAMSQSGAHLFASSTAMCGVLERIVRFVRRKCEQTNSQRR